MKNLISELKANAHRIKSISEYYNTMKQSAPQSSEEALLIKSRMKYGRSEILRLTFDNKKILRELESHIS